MMMILLEDEMKIELRRRLMKEGKKEVGYQIEMEDIRSINRNRK